MRLIDRVEHFVVLMMENRSYDQMLGGLRDPRYAGLPVGNDDRIELPYDGPAGLRHVAVRRGSPPDRFWPDPPHSFDATRAQIYGAPPPQEEANMMGFARQFYRELEGSDAKKQRSLEEFATVYDEGRLPVLHALARRFAVCTHWFSSMPGPTNTNRAFAHAGTSLGRTEQSSTRWQALGGETVFDRLQDPALCRVYHDGPPNLWLMGDQWMRDRRDIFRRFSRFADDVRQDRLPTYAFLEPRHTILPRDWTSQHPPAAVSAGERVIASVFDTLLAKPEVFSKTLLLVVYDEHGGFFDHVIPPGHSGWADQPRAPQAHTVVAPDDARENPDGFAFDQLGVRVPAVLVSPWLESGTVLGWHADDDEFRRTFDHCSILATLKRMIPAANLRHSRRVREAATLDVPVSRAQARSVDECGGPLLPVWTGSTYGPAGVSEHSEEIAGPARELANKWKAGDGAADDQTALRKVEERVRALLG